MRLLRYTLCITFKGSILVSTYYAQEFRSCLFKIDCLDMEHVYHAVSILFPGCRVHSKSFDFYSTVLYFLLQARHHRPTTESLSRVDDVNEFRFEGSTTDEETIDVGLESYLRSRSVWIILQPRS